MGIADRDYMRERAEARGAVFRPGTRHASPGRQGLLKIMAGAAVAIGVVPVYQYLESLPASPPPPMLPTTILPAAPALTPPGVVPQVGEGQVEEFPASGTTQWYRQTDPRQQTGILRIMDTSDLRGNKVVRIRDAFGTPVLQTYIRFEEGAQLVLPLGHYEMTIATGDTWYGADRQFGPGASYFRTTGTDVIAGEMNYRILPSNQGGQPMASIPSDAF